jgi:hypothetical protein
VRGKKKSRFPKENLHFSLTRRRKEYPHNTRMPGEKQ